MVGKALMSIVLGIRKDYVVVGTSVVALDLEVPVVRTLVVGIEVDHKVVAVPLVVERVVAFVEVTHSRSASPVLAVVDTVVDHKVVAVVGSYQLELDLVVRTVVEPVVHS